MAVPPLHAHNVCMTPLPSRSGKPVCDQEQRQGKQALQGTQALQWGHQTESIPADGLRSLCAVTDHEQRRRPCCITANGSASGDWGPLGLPPCRGAAPRSSMGPHLPGLLHTLQPPSVHLTEDSQLRSAFASLLSCVIPACGPAAATTEHRSALLWLSLHAASQAAPPRAASLPPASHASSAPRSAAGHAGATGDRSGGSGSSSSPAPVPTLGTLLLQLASAVGRHGASAGPMASFQLLELEPDDDHPPAGAAMAQERTHEADTRARECPTAAVQALLSESRPEFIQRIQLSSSTNSTLQAGVLAFLLLPNSGGPSNAPQLPPSQALLSRVVQAADAAAMTHATHSGTRASEPNSEAHGLPPAPTAPAPCCPSGTAPPDIWSDASASTACFRHLAAQLPWLRSHPASAGSVLVALECSLGCHPGAPQQGLDLPTSPRRRPKPLDPGSAEVLLLELLLPALAAFQATAAPAPSSASPAAQRGSSSSTPLLLALRCAMAAVSSGRLPSSLLQRCLGAGPLQEVLSACVASHHVPCRLQVRGKVRKPAVWAGVVSRQGSVAVPSSTSLSAVLEPHAHIACMGLSRSQPAPAPEPSWVWVGHARCSDASPAGCAGSAPAQVRALIAVDPSDDRRCGCSVSRRHLSLGRCHPL